MKFRWALCGGAVFLWTAAFVEPSFGATSKKEAAADEDSSSSKKDPGDTHEVKRGETLWGIARKYDVSVGELMDLNHMPNDKVHEGQTLKIPQPGESVPLTPLKPSVHVVKKGETFRAIARANHISADELEQANPKVDPDHPKVGAKLKIPVPASYADDKTSSADHPAKYVVKEDDTFRSIAKAHGTTSGAIAKANPDVDPDRLRPGLKLVLPVKPAKDSEDTEKKKDATTSGEEKPPAKSQGTHHYVIGHGEDAESIADAFGISVKQLCKINGGKAAGSFKAGSEILVPNDK